MQKYAAEEQFEKAAKMRDSYLDLQKTLERQKVVYENTKLNEDVIALLYEDGILAIVIMIGIIIGILAVVGIVTAVICSIAKTPRSLRGFYGAMFWTIAIIAIVGVSALAVIGIL